jgi:hypothetical protein
MAFAKTLLTARLKKGGSQGSGSAQPFGRRRGAVPRLESRQGGCDGKAHNGNQTGVAARLFL